jgi:hypothetical protein
MEILPEMFLYLKKIIIIIIKNKKADHHGGIDYMSHVLHFTCI